MEWKNLRLGVALTGSFCTFEKVFPYISELVNKGAEVYPIVSFSVASMDTRFGTAKGTLDKLKEITGKEVITTIQGAEPVGPKLALDAFIIAPCTGNTLAKLANGIVDTPVLMAAKSHLRNNRPLVLSISTNDALGINNKNLATVMNTKNIYIVPFGQDNFDAKPNSLISNLDTLISTIEFSISKLQVQPILIKY